MTDSPWFVPACIAIVAISLGAPLLVFIIPILLVIGLLILIIGGPSILMSWFSSKYEDYNRKKGTWDDRFDQN